MKIYKGLDEKDMTKNEACPLWIWCVIRNGFIARTLQRFTGVNCRFKVKRDITPNGLRNVLAIKPLQITHQFL